MGLRLLVVALAAAYFCTAMPTVDTVVPENLNLAAFSKLSPTAFVQAMTNSGGTEQDCRDFASNTISEITTTVQSQQGLLDAFDTGAGCASEGQGLVTVAQAGLTRAQVALATAEGAAATALAAMNTACEVDVNFDIPLDIILQSSCYETARVPAYVTAQSDCDSARSVKATADAAVVAADSHVDAAQSLLDEAVAEAARLMSECYCRVQTQQADAWGAATAASSTHAADWTQAHQILCAVDQSSSCTVPPTPTLTQPQVHSGMQDEQCGSDEESDDEGPPTEEAPSVQDSSDPGLSCTAPRPCVFPFTYYGVEYNACTSIGAGGVGVWGECWCSTAAATVGVPEMVPSSGDWVGCHAPTNRLVPYPGQADSDACIQAASGWGSSYTCASSLSTQYCTTWQKDMYRCCANACGVTRPATIEQCNASGGSGTCTGY